MKKVPIPLHHFSASPHRYFTISPPYHLICLLLCLLAMSCQNGKPVGEEKREVPKSDISKLESTSQEVLKDSVSRDFPKVPIQIGDTTIVVELTGNFLWQEPHEPYSRNYLEIREIRPNVLATNRRVHYSFKNDEGQTEKSSFAMASKLLFFNKEGKLINQLVLEDLNPYKSFDKPEIMQNFWSETSYVENPEQEEVVRYWTMHQFSPLRNNFYTATFNKHYINKDDQVIRTEVTIIAFDSLGNRLGEIKDIPHYVSHYAVSQDGKYMGVNIGESFYGLPEEVLFYDLSTGNLVYHFKERTGIVVECGPYLWTAGSDESGQRIRYEFDLSRGLMYKKIFDGKTIAELNQKWLVWERQGLNPITEAIKYFNYEKIAIR